jgi:hypothetical protein
MNLKILLILSLWFASVNSVAKTEIDGAFGVKFGDVWTSESMYFEPEIKLPGFHYYSVDIGPISKRVWGIYARNERLKWIFKGESLKTSVCNSYYVETLNFLEDIYGKFDRSIFTNSDSHTYSDGQSDVSISRAFLGGNYKACTLLLQYGNNFLDGESEKERKALEKNKRAIKFKGIDL